MARRDPAPSSVRDIDLGSRAESDLPPRVSPRRFRGAVAVLVALLLVGGLAGAGVLGLRALVGSVGTGSDDYSGAGSGSVVVQVHPGDTAADIGAALARAGVVKTAAAFRRAATADERSRSLQPGFYRLARHMSAGAALELMLDPASLVQSRVVVPEGTTARGVAELLTRDAAFPAADVRSALGSPGRLGLPPYAKGRVEGFLYPATYSFPPGTTAVTALEDMVRRYAQAAEEVGLEAGARAAGRTPYEVLIVASIVQGEARFPEDFPKVAAVAYNRLARGMPLQMDATINYVLPERKGHLTSEDIAIDSPYNSYRRTGLPPTPIGSPGELALQAALHPAAGELLYFVTIDRAGHNAFTDSYEEFLRLKAEGARNRG